MLSLGSATRSMCERLAERFPIDCICFLLRMFKFNSEEFWSTLREVTAGNFEWSSFADR
jgi:hypothetical protein